MPGLGLGTWKSDPGVVGGAIQTAIEVGYRHIDCAAIYGNEAEIGVALKEVFEGGIVERDDLFLTSKLWNAEHAPEDVEPALRKTLEDLQVDVLDLYLMHWPVALRKDRSEGESEFISLEEIPLIDTWRAMEKCVDKGLVKDIGVSNFSKKKLQEIVAKARINPSINQIESHPYLQLQDLIDYCASENIHVTAYSPLGSNDRAAAMKREEEVPILEDTTIAAIAKKYSTPNDTGGETPVTPAQVLLAWALARGTSVIPKSVSSSRQKENLQAAMIELKEDDMMVIAELDRHFRYLDGSFWCPEGSPYTMQNLWDENEEDVQSEMVNEL
jgi:alcohol dehydrogenase (NADP+)